MRGFVACLLILFFPVCLSGHQCGKQTKLGFFFKADCAKYLKKTSLVLNLFYNSK